MATISFEDARRFKEEIGRRAINTSSARISDIELMLQTNWLTTLNRNASEADIVEKDELGNDCIVAINRFLEYDAGNNIPVFKSFKINYNECWRTFREIYDRDFLGVADDPEVYLNLLKNGTKEIGLNVATPHGFIHTSWGVTAGILSLVVSAGSIYLWEEAPTYIVISYMAMKFVSNILGVKMGPVSFVCNKLLTTKSKLDEIGCAIDSFRKLVKIDADLSFRQKLYDIMNDFYDTTDDAEINKDEAAEKFKGLEENMPLDKDLVETYYMRYDFDIIDECTRENFFEIKSVNIKLPEIRVVE